MRRHQCQLRDKENEGKIWARAFLVVSTGGKKKHLAGLADLRLAILNHFGSLWGIGAVPSYLLLGPETVRTGA